MKHKKSLYISTKLQEKQIDIEFYVEEFKKYIYCEEAFICLKTHLNYEFLTTFLYLWSEIFCGFSYFL